MSKCPMTNVLRYKDDGDTEDQKIKNELSVKLKLCSWDNYEVIISPCELGSLIHAN